MSGILERLWRPSPKDTAGGLIAQERIAVNNGPNALAAVNVPVTAYTGTINFLAVITRIGFVATPGAAQIFSALTIQIRDPGGNVAFYQDAYDPGYVLGANVVHRSAVNLGDGLMIRPLELLTVTGIFNAGGAANTLQTFVYGYKLPLGNIL